jgi:pyruvate kinase
METIGTAVATGSSEGRRAKIVCTLGPASFDPSTIVALVEAGMDVARLNLSYGTPEEHLDAITNVREAAETARRTVAVMADVRGPKLRTGPFAEGSVILTEGDPFVLTSEDMPGDSRRVYMGTIDFSSKLRQGDRVLLRDGRVVLNVKGVDNREIRTQVVRGGEITDYAGINLPGTDLGLPPLMQRDADDLAVMLRAGVDLVALSFVRSADDVKPVRKVMGEVGRTVPVIAKLERPQAVDALEEVCRAFDGIMVARGDLGIELPLEQVPLVQKTAIATARQWGRPSIVATEMLESMITAPRPTRAEVSDVANAVMDGADALMLSAETAVGRRPVEATRTMANVITAAESQAAYPSAIDGDPTFDDAVARAAVDVASRIQAGSIAVFTESGSTARRVARYRPSTPILAMAPGTEIACQLSATWGVQTLVVPRVDSTDEVVGQVDRTLVETRAGQPGDHVVIVCGTPIGVSGTTNLIRVHTLEGR